MYLLGWETLVLNLPAC